MATLQRDSVPTNLNQTNIQPVYDIYASVQGRDLGSIAGDIGKITAELQKELKPGNTIRVVGQIQSMHDSFRDLGTGLLFAAVFVYLLMVFNYQNFGDPFVVILALPATFCGEAKNCSSTTTLYWLSIFLRVSCSFVVRIWASRTGLRSSRDRVRLSSTLIKFRP